MRQFGVDPALQTDVDCRNKGEEQDVIFLYDAEPEHADQWRALLAAQLPDVAFVEGFEAVDPARVHYLLTWQPVADIERYTSLRIIFLGWRRGGPV